MLQLLHKIRVGLESRCCLLLLGIFPAFTGLLDLRSVMRFFWPFPPAIGHALFSLAVGHALFSPAVGYAFFLRLTSTFHLSCQPPTRACTWSPAHLEKISSAAYSRKSCLKFYAFCFISLPMDANRHSRPSPSCHVSRAVSSHLTQNQDEMRQIWTIRTHQTRCDESGSPKRVKIIISRTSLQEA